MKDRFPYSKELVTHDGVTHSLKQWAEILGINYRAFSIRYARGARGADLFRELNPYNAILTVKGETHNLTEWSKITGIPSVVIRRRAQRGWEDDRIFEGYTPNPRKSHPVDLREKFRQALKQAKN